MVKLIGFGRRLDNLPSLRHVTTKNCWNLLCERTKRVSLLATTWTVSSTHCSSTNVARVTVSLHNCLPRLLTIAMSFGITRTDVILGIQGTTMFGHQISFSPWFSKSPTYFPSLRQDQPAAWGSHYPAHTAKDWQRRLLGHPRHLSHLFLRLIFGVEPPTHGNWRFPFCPPSSSSLRISLTLPCVIS